MSTIEFLVMCYALLWCIGLTALLGWANYKANFIYKDGKTVIDWNSRGEGKPEFFIFAFSLILAIISLFIFVLGGN